MRVNRIQMKAVRKKCKDRMQVKTVREKMTDEHEQVNLHLFFNKAHFLTPVFLYESSRIDHCQRLKVDSEGPNFVRKPPATQNQSS